MIGTSAAKMFLVETVGTNNKKGNDIRLQSSPSTFTSTLTEAELALTPSNE